MSQHYKPGTKPGQPPQGPDPAVEEAINKLTQTQLSPLEEVMYNSWANANQLDTKNEQPFDYRKLYQATGGKVFAPGELKGLTDKLNAVETLMRAQEAHESSSPVQQLMAAHQAKRQISPMPSHGPSGPAPFDMGTALSHAERIGRPPGDITVNEAKYAAHYPPYDK